MATTILITGATGTIGSALVRTLTAQGVPVRIFVRNLEKAAALAAPTVDVAQGDLTDPASIAAAMEGIETVFLLTAAGPDQRTWQGNVVQAAVDAEVKHIVKLSALGVSPDSPIKLARWHADVEQQIVDSGLGYTFLHPHSFMQNLLGSIEPIKHQGAFYGATRDGTFSAVDGRDVAAVAAVVVQDPAPHQGQTYAITGPEALSSADMAAQLSEALGKPVQYVDLPPEAFQQALVDAGMPSWLAETLKDLHLLFASGHTAAVSPVVADLTGQPGISFAQFARDYADAFRE